MAKWEFISDYGQHERPNPNSGYRWIYPGEVTLSLHLGRKAPRSSIGRYELRWVIDNPQLAATLISGSDRAYAIEQTSRGELFVSDPFWEGFNPDQLRAYFNERFLPEPPGYAKYWREIRDTHIQNS